MLQSTAGAVAEGRNLTEPDTDQVELRDVAREERRALAIAGSPPWT
jgi:hypothetical protein